MKTFTKLLMIFALLAITLPATSTFAQGTPNYEARGRGQMGKHMEQGMGKGLMQVVVPPRMLLRHAEALELSEGQIQQIEVLLATFQEESEGLRENLKQEATKLRELLEAPTVNSAVALAQADRVMALENQLKRARLQMMIETKSTLNRAQVAQLQELRKEHRQQRRGQQRQKRRLQR